MTSTPYTKAVADLCNNQKAHLCGVLMILPDNRRATVDEEGKVMIWEAGEDGRLFLSETKPFEGVVE